MVETNVTRLATLLKARSIICVGGIDSAPSARSVVSFSKLPQNARRRGDLMARRDRRGEALDRGRRAERAAGVVPGGGQGPRPLPCILDGAVGTKWYPATIARVGDDGEYDLAYDDGDFEERVQVRYVKYAKLQPRPPTPPTPPTPPVKEEEEIAVQEASPTEEALPTEAEGYKLPCRQSRAPALVRASPLPTTMASVATRRTTRICTSTASRRPSRRPCAMRRR